MRKEDEIENWRWEEVEEGGRWKRRDVNNEE